MCDAVLAYTGVAAAAPVSYRGTSTLRIDTYSRGQLAILVRAVGPYEGDIALPAGPAFVSVTAAGKWSITLGETPR
jgi:hypothetical protein